MSIGLYDDDFMTYTFVPFNLELMKISSYYKQKKEIVVLAPKLEPERYNKFIVRKDYQDGSFKKEFFESNVEYGGYAFSSNKYNPLPEDIELTKPDKYLYEKYRHLFEDTKKNKTLFQTFINAEHIRLSLDNKNIWSNSYKTYTISNLTRAIIFHDYDLNSIKDSDLAVKEIISKMNKNIPAGRLIGMKFPVQIYNEKDFRKWIIFNPTSRLFSMQYNGLMNDEFFEEFLLTKNSRSIMRNLYYNVTYGLSSENDFIEKVLPNIFKQVLFSRIHNTKILLKYDDNFFIDKRWERLIKLINNYCNQDSNEYKKMLKPGLKDYSKDYTLFRYITTPNFFKASSKYIWTIEELRDLFQLVREKSYETFRMFYESCLVELKGGKIVDV